MVKIGTFVMLANVLPMFALELRANHLLGSGDDVVISRELIGPVRNAP